MDKIKYTNRHNLAPEVVRAIIKDRYTVEGERGSDYSITDIISPIQVTILKKRYADDLVIKDVIDLFWSFMGSVAHQVLEDSWHKEMQSTVEERIYLSVRGKTISGKIDCYQHEAIIVKGLGEDIILEADDINKGMIDGDLRPPQIRDYKTTKVWNIMKGNHTKWEEQTNAYAGLLQEMGKPVERIVITCLLFDWNKNQTFKEGYPKAPIVDLEMPLWSIEDQLRYIDEKVYNLSLAEDMSDEGLALAFDCSEEDMWMNFKDYAIMKHDGERAVKTFEDFNSAMEHFKNTKSITEKTHKIIKRVGERKRCFEHCDVANHCVQHRRLCEKEGVPVTYPNHDIHVEPLF